MDPRLQSALTERPLIAILRGITPSECEAVAEALIDAGFSMLEVTLNSPEPWESLRRLQAHCPAEILVGAGTVPTYLAGMVGARQGWCEAPQPPLPCTASDLATQVIAAPGLDNVWLLPGVRVHGGHGHVT